MSAGTELRQSYALCARIMRSKARNFYYAFVLLPREKREAICAIYAFMRHCDDLADDPSLSPEKKRDALETMRARLVDALREGKTAGPIFPALTDTVRRFSIPEKYLHELLDGVEMDLEKNRYRTFEELYPYCYRVASVVGLVCIHIFGFEDQKAIEHAEQAGIAFQLTNILRDIREDYLGNRIYLPLEDLEQYHYSEEDLSRGIVDSRFEKLLRFEIKRARDYYLRGEALLPLVHPESRKALSALFGIYRGLLEKINLNYVKLFRGRIRLSLFEKLQIVYGAWKSPAREIVVA